MKGICCWTAAVLAFAAITSAYLLVAVPSHDDSRVPAQVCAAGDPVAVITPLPDYVSNGSWHDLDGSGSYDPNGGLITDWFWEIDFNGTVETSHASVHQYWFPDVGLYKITLTVTDSQNQTNKSFTAVVAILDQDSDYMPDWWEQQYFDSLSEIGSGDNDSDGYTNLEEYAKGTDPTVKDPQPGFVDEMITHWYVFVLVAAIIVAIVLSMWPFFRKRRKVQEKKKIAAAIAIEKELEQEGSK